jgi:hypothetical protein
VGGVALLNSGNPILTERFMTEATATLPFAGGAGSLNDNFSVVSVQQAKDQQIPVWEPVAD